jgi:hypothetical protein
MVIYVFGMTSVLRQEYVDRRGYPYSDSNLHPSDREATVIISTVTTNNF